MESNLFVSLSDEQQELVAGGGQLIGYDQDSDTFLDLFQKKSDTTIVKHLESGLGGSKVSFGVTNKYQESDFSTGANEDVFLDFD